MASARSPSHHESNFEDELETETEQNEKTIEISVSKRMNRFSKWMFSSALSDSRKTNSCECFQGSLH